MAERPEAILQALPSLLEFLSSLGREQAIGLEAQAKVIQERARAAERAARSLARRATPPSSSTPAPPQLPQAQPVRADQPQGPGNFTLADITGGRGVKSLTTQVAVQPGGLSALPGPAPGQQIFVERPPRLIPTFTIQPDAEALRLEILRRQAIGAVASDLMRAGVDPAQALQAAGQFLEGGELPKSLKLSEEQRTRLRLLREQLATEQARRGLIAAQTQATLAEAELDAARTEEILHPRVDPIRWTIETARIAQDEQRARAQLASDIGNQLTQAGVPPREVVRVQRHILATGQIPENIEGLPEKQAKTLQQALEELRLRSQQIDLLRKSDEVGLIDPAEYVDRRILAIERAEEYDPSQLPALPVNLRERASKLRAELDRAETARGKQSAAFTSALEELNHVYLRSGRAMVFKTEDVSKLARGLSIFGTGQKPSQLIESVPLPKFLQVLSIAASPDVPKDMRELAEKQIRAWGGPVDSRHGFRGTLERMRRGDEDAALGSLDPAIRPIWRRHLRMFLLLPQDVKEDIVTGKLLSQGPAVPPEAAEAISPGEPVPEAVR